MKYCAKCGSQLADDAAFCTYCGAYASGGAPETRNQPAETTDQPSVTPEQPREESIIGESLAVSMAPEEAQPRKSRRKLVLMIGIPAVLLVIAAAAAAILLIFGNPKQQFERGIMQFFNDFSKIEGNELSDRMAAEPYDLSMDMDLSNLSRMLGGQEDMLSGLALSGGYKNNKDEQAGRISAGMAGIDVFNLAAMVEQDRLLLGYYAPQLTGTDTVNAVSMKLTGKPGDPLAERLSNFTNSAAQQGDAYQKLQGKVTKYLLDSLDPKWYSRKNGEITDAVTGKTTGTTAYELKIRSQEAITLLRSMFDMADKDPDFYSLLDQYMLANGTTVQNSREELKKGLDDAIAYLEEEQLDFSMTVHYAGFTPVAIEAGFALPGDSGVSMKALIQKNRQQGEAAYRIAFNATPAGSQPMDCTIKLNISKSQAGHDFDGKFSFDFEGQSMSLDLNGTATVDKMSSTEYGRNTKFNLGWIIPGTPAGSIDLELKEKILFGSGIVPLTQDTKYQYDRIKAGAKEVETIEQLTEALSGGLMPPVQLP